MINFYVYSFNQTFKPLRVWLL